MAWAPDYASSAELKAYLRIGDTVDDTQIALAITAASRAIDQLTSRQFGLIAAPEARYYAPRYDRRACRWKVDTDDFMTTVGLLIAVDSVGDQTYSSAITDYLLTPPNSASTSRPWTGFTIGANATTLPTRTDLTEIKVTARFGWTAVPDPVKQATLLQASRVIARRDAPFGVAGSPDAGSELRLLSRVDPDVEVILRSYRRVWGAV